MSTRLRGVKLTLPLSLFLIVADELRVNCAVIELCINAYFKFGTVVLALMQHLLHIYGGSRDRDGRADAVVSHSGGTRWIFLLVLLCFLL